MRTINLHGKLKEVLGDSFEADVNTVPEIISYLRQHDTQGKLDELLQSDAYKIILSDGVNDTIVTDEIAAMAFTSEDKIIDVMPMAEGDKSKYTQLGIGLVVAGIGLGTGNMALAKWGATIAVGGIASALAPTPPDDQASLESSIYNGGKNTSQAGVAIPLVYGYTRTGSIQASFGLDVVDWNTEE